jgi:multidrug efflux pump subunit AcrB
MRIEETEKYFGRVETMIRQVIPAGEISVILDNIGIPNSGINMALSDGTLISPADGEIMVSLNPDHRSTWEYIRAIRLRLAREFPDAVYFFSPADITTQILNFGLPAPIDIQIAGPTVNRDQNLAVARRIADEVAEIPGAVDVRLAQVPVTPDLRVDVDRTLAGKVGLTQRDVASDLLISLSSSTQTAPNFWLNPQSGVNYNILVQTPQYLMSTMNALQNTPIVAAEDNGTESTQLLGNLASIGRGASATNYTHRDIFNTYDVMLGVQGTDLGSVSNRVRAIADRYTPQLPRGSTIALRGQIESMSSSFVALTFGLIFAVILVYLLMVINFQSWLDPLIILMALPSAMCGIVWMLYATRTTFSVPSLMGAIMCIGVATSNSILMITFANDQRRHGVDAVQAALAAGMTRLRPVVMTALAMIIGMLPLSLGLSEGGEQNSPLGRAVIGGLLMATFGTLIFVPVMYSILRRVQPQFDVEEELRDER